MQKLPISIHVPFPIVLKRIKFFEVGKVDNYEDEYHNENAFAQLENDLVSLLRSIQANDELYLHFSINIILSNNIIRQIGERQSLLMDLLKEMKQGDKVSLSLDSSDFKKSPFFKKLVKQELYQFKKAFGTVPDTHFCCKSLFKKTDKNRILKKGTDRFFPVTMGDKSNSSKTQNLRKIPLSCAVRLLKNHRLKEWHEFKSIHGINGFVLNYREAYTLLQDWKVYPVQSTGLKTEFTPLVEEEVFQSKTSKMPEDRVGGKPQYSELQKETIYKLVGLSKKKGLLNNEGLLQQYSLLCQEDLFQLMDTQNPDSYGSDNPYQSPYETYINTMNILNDFQVKIAQQL